MVHWDVSCASLNHLDLIKSNIYYVLFSMHRDDNEEGEKGTGLTCIRADLTDFMGILGILQSCKTICSSMIFLKKRLGVALI